MRGTPFNEPRCFSANARLVTIIAAAPSDVAQISSKRNGSLTTGLFNTSSTAFSLRKRAFGLLSPCIEFFTLTWAKSSDVAPYRSIRRRANKAKYAGLVAPKRWKRNQSGSFFRSPPPTGAKNPFGVVSAPITIATSQKPARIEARAV